jgi:zinc transporter ZupT
MADVLSTFAATALATFVPLYIGLFFPPLLGKGSRGSLFFVAASVGIISWFFLDVAGDAALLDVNQGFGGDYTHVVLAGSFAFGFLLLFGLERWSTPSSFAAASEAMTGGSQFTFAIAFVAALGIGFHALGEGLSIGSVVPNATSILDAIGGLGPGIAYVLHKFLEGLVVGAFAMLARSRYGQIGILGIASGLPTLLGFLLGLPSTLESTYFFAIGASGAVYIEFKLIPKIFEGRAKFSTLVFTLIGFYSMYTAGLFHG